MGSCQQKTTGQDLEQGDAANSPLIIATLLNKPTCFKLLMMAGADILKLSYTLKYRPLHMSTEIRQIIDRTLAHEMERKTRLSSHCSLERFKKKTIYADKLKEIQHLQDKDYKEELENISINVHSKKIKNAQELENNFMNTVLKKKRKRNENVAELENNFMNAVQKRK